MGEEGRWERHTPSKEELITKTGRQPAQRRRQEEDVRWRERGEEDARETGDARSVGQKRARAQGVGQRQKSARARERGGKESAREREGREGERRAREGRRRSGAASRTKRNCGAAAAVGSKDVAWLPAYCPNPKSPYYQPMSQEISPQISQPWNLVVYVQVRRLIAISLRLIGRPEF
ncbi:hypothetical protein PVAP13_5NG442940 [Panicum virgatum]|uniref:Uncharacterized protein n=1 Tax=Panicum virgatum TaxID=38727 RepID=A0A8T0RYZ2_PANVG|nr:hypothetical protein PVAP13_5NG442940 [Panicum virgatum]